MSRPCQSCPSLVPEWDPHPLCYSHRDCSKSNKCASFCIGLSDIHFEDLESSARLGLRHRQKTKTKKQKPTGKIDMVGTSAAGKGHAKVTSGAPVPGKQADPPGTASEPEGLAASESTDLTSKLVAGSRAVLALTGEYQSTSEISSEFLAGGHPSIAGERAGLAPAEVAGDGQYAKGTPGLPGLNPSIQRAADLPRPVCSTQRASGTPGLPGLIHGTQHAFRSPQGSNENVHGFSRDDTGANASGVVLAEPTGVVTRQRSMVGPPSDSLGLGMAAGCPPGLASGYTGVGLAVSHGTATQVQTVAATETSYGSTSVVATMHAPIAAVSGPPHTATLGEAQEVRVGSLNSLADQQPTYVLESQQSVGDPLQSMGQLPSYDRSLSIQRSMAPLIDTAYSGSEVTDRGYTRSATRDTRQAPFSQGTASIAGYPYTRLDPLAGNAVRHGYSGTQPGALPGTYATTTQVPQYSSWLPQSLWQQGGGRRYWYCRSMGFPWWRILSGSATNRVCPVVSAAGWFLPRSSTVASAA